MESGTFRGRRAAKTVSVPRGVSKWGRPQPHVRGSRGERLNRGVRCSGEVGVPAVEVVGELVVEDAGADLNEQMGACDEDWYRILNESPRRVRRLHVDRNYATPSILKPL